MYQTSDIPVVRVICNDTFDGFTPIGKIRVLGMENYNLWGYIPFRRMEIVVQTKEIVAAYGSDTDVNFYVATEVQYNEQGDFTGVVRLDIPIADTNNNHSFVGVLLDFGIRKLFFADEDTKKLFNELEASRMFSYYFGLYQRFLLTIHSGCEAKLCRITDKQKRINERRIKDGKKPVYEEQTIKIKPSIYYKPTGQPRNYTPPCAHQRRGHFRTYPSGKRGWVKDCKVSQGSERSVKSNYIFEYDVV